MGSSFIMCWQLLARERRTTGGKRGNQKCSGRWARSSEEEGRPQSESSIRNPTGGANLVQRWEVIKIQGVNPALWLLSVYPREGKAYVYTNTCTWIFIAALFITTPNWEPSQCPSASERINQMCYIHTLENHSAIWKGQIMDTYNNTDEPRRLSERSHSQGKVPLHDSICTTRSTSQHCQGLGVRGGDDYKGGAWKNFLQLMELLCALLLVMITWMYTCVKIHRTVQASRFHCRLIKKVNFLKEKKWAIKKIKGVELERQDGIRR